MGAQENHEIIISELAICESSTIGKRTRIWPLSHVLAKAVIGADCNICENVFVENDVSIGDRVTIKNGVQICDGITNENDVFVGPNVTFTNDRYPKSKNKNFSLERTHISKGASIGANSTILPGIRIGEGAVIGEGSVVTRDVEANCVVIGNPARKIRGLPS
jgi:acetyltransferase-like isoleucine patch superfamily enzyme